MHSFNASTAADLEPAALVLAELRRRADESGVDIMVEPHQAVLERFEFDPRSAGAYRIGCEARDPMARERPRIHHDNIGL